MTEPDDPFLVEDVDAVDPKATQSAQEPKPTAEAPANEQMRLKMEKRRSVLVTAEADAAAEAADAPGPDSKLAASAETVDEPGPKLAEETSLSQQPTADAVSGATSIEKPTAKGTSAADMSEIKELKELLEKPPGEITAWMLSQTKLLENPETSLESLPIFKVATALKSAPVEQKEALVSNMMKGVGDLPLAKRAEALRFMTQLPNPNGASNLGAASSSSKGDVGASNSFSANLARIAQEAAFTEMSTEDREKISLVVEQEQVHLVQPLLDAVPELSEEERKQFTETLVSKGMVSEDSRAMLEDTMKPGGHADQVSGAMKSLARAYKYAWTVWALPVLEIALAVGLSQSGSSVPLLHWLVADTVLAVFIAFAAYAAKRAVKPAYLEFSDSPLKMSKRVQESMAEGTKLTDAIPGLAPGATLIAVMCGLVFISGFMVIMGIIQLESTVYSSIPEAPRLTAIILCVPIMVFRVLSPVALVSYAAKGWRKYKEFKQQTSSSQPLRSDEESNYGTVEGQPPV